jgi:hypothetical protein
MPAVQSFHCTSPRKLALSGVDPSLALGFLCQDAADAAAFLEFATAQAAERHPLFAVA